MMLRLQACISNQRVVIEQLQKRRLEPAISQPTMAPSIDCTMKLSESQQKSIE
jgi:hypothetical protein